MNKGDLLYGVISGVVLAGAMITEVACTTETEAQKRTQLVMQQDISGEIASNLLDSTQETLDERIVAEYQEKSRQNIEDPHNRIRFLNDSEYVMPDDVIKALVGINPEDFDKGYSAKGVYSPDGFSETQLKIFRNNLDKLNVKDKKAYSILLHQPNIIIYNEENFQYDLFSYFEEVILHERAHMRFASFTTEERQPVIEAQKDLSERPELQQSPIFSKIVAINYQEFFAYFVSREITGYRGKILKEDHPKAYDLVMETREMLRLK